MHTLPPRYGRGSIQSGGRETQDSAQRTQAKPTAAKRRRINGKQRPPEASSADTVDEVDAKFEELLPVIELSAKASVPRVQTVPAS